MIIVLAFITCSCQSKGQDKKSTLAPGENVVHNYTEKGIMDEYLNLGKCNFEIEKFFEQNEITTDEGMIKPSGNNKLLKVKITGVSESSGRFITTPITNTCVFNYRRTIASVNSIAFGSVGRSKSTGEYSEIWFKVNNLRSIIS